jgi:hypothetical protein
MRLELNRHGMAPGEIKAATRTDGETSPMAHGPWVGQGVAGTATVPVDLKPDRDILHRFKARGRVCRTAAVPRR